MEAPITPTCNRFAWSAAAAALIAATPAAADVGTPQLGAYLEARVASEAGENERAGREFRALLAADPQSPVLARRALQHGLMAGDWPLALDAARRLDAAGALPPLRRIFLIGAALKEQDWAAADAQITRLEQDQALAIMAPLLRAWRAQGSGEGDPMALLAPMASGTLSGYAAEHGALIRLARGEGDPQQFAALDPSSGLRAQRLRLAAAAEFAARGQRDQALAVVAGDHPAFVAARRLIEAGQPIPGRIDSAADGVSELLARVAIDFSQQQLAGEGVMLARIAQYLAPDSSQAAIIAAELLAEREPATAIQVLDSVAANDPFVQSARDLRVRLLARSGQSERALAEVRARIDRGSRAPDDWTQYGDLLLELDRSLEAAEAYERAHRLWQAGTFPAIPEWTLWLARGGALERGGRWPEALRALQEAYRLAPNQPLVLNYLGYAQLERGENLEQAEVLVREANRLAPGNAAITDSLGWALYMRGRIDEAIPLLERAVQGAPDDVEINEHLGDAYFASGRRIEARFAWQAALIYADAEDSARIRAKIERGLPTRTAAR